MNKKIFTREVRVGIMAVVAIFILYFGLNFLKGLDIFSSTSVYYAQFNNLDGLVVSSPVFVKGFKVGQVDDIHYDFSKETSFIIKISVDHDIQIPKGGKIELFDNGLMGGKAIQLVFDPITPSQVLYASGDTVASQIGGGLMAELSGDLMPKIQSISTQADSLLRSVRLLIEKKEINNSLSSIEKTTSELALTSTQLKKMMHSDMPRILTDVNAITGDMKHLTGNLKKIDFAATFASIDHTINNLNLVSDKMNKSEGSLGLLINDKSLYNNLNNTVANADKLVIDLKQNPKRYVHFSVFSPKQP